MTKIKRTKNDNDKTIEAHVGDTVVIDLPENPTTGYLWTIKTIQGKESVNVNNPTFKVENDPKREGGGGVRTFNLDIRTSGTAAIEITLRRNWEPESAAIDSFKAVIEVC